MTSITDVIGHYQRSIEKSAHDEARLLHCIEKLYKLPVTVEHLQQTGIGKTVNSLRKYDKEVGVAAKALVAKWKAMVAAEEELVDDEDSQKANDNDQSNSDDENYRGSSQNNQVNQNGKYDSHKPKQSSSRNEKISDADKRERRHKENGREQSHSHSRQSSSDTKKSNSILSDRHNRDKTNNSSPPKHYKDKETSDDHRANQKQHENKRRAENMKSSSDHSSRKARLPEPVHESPPPNVSDDNLYENDCDDNVDDEDEEKLIIDTENTKEKFSEETIKHSSRDPAKSTKSSTHSKNSSRRSHDDENRKESEHHSHKRKTDDRDKKDTSKKYSSSKNSIDKVEKNKSDDHHKSDKKEQQEKKINGEYKPSKDKQHQEKSKDTEKRSSSKSEDSKSSKDKKSSSSRKSSKRKHDSAEESESDAEHSSPKKLKSVKKKIVDGIDSSMGSFSFEEALGMMAPPAKVPAPKLKSPKANGTTSTSSSSTSKSRSSSSSSSSPSGSTRSKTPPLLTSKVTLEPLDPKLSLDLPTISPNYKPMPLNPTVMDCVFANNNINKPIAPPRRLMTDDEALQNGISSKTMRTKIYSGVRSGAILQVPTLYKLCQRVLQKNIDALEYTGGVPFHVLKPIIELATPRQLTTFEEFNPYLIEETDELWMKHCNRRYKSQKREEMESWREMYMRCQEDEEERLSKLTKNISYTQKQIAAPIKRTQLAYVDMDVKPPRNIQRKQEQFGTKGKLIATPASRVEALCKVTPSAAKIGDTRLRVAADVRDYAQASTHVRPKKAPLMQKTLQLMKGRFKR